MSISISEASPHCPRMMMAKAQQINFESRVLLTVLHEAYQKKKHTQGTQKKIEVLTMVLNSVATAGCASY
jgi:hypothetical protein